MPRDNRCMYMAHVSFYVCCNGLWGGGVCGNVCCVSTVVEDCVFLVLECCVFCFYCDAWSCRCSFMGSMNVRGDHIERPYSSRAGLMTALKVSMSVSFCLPHPVAVSAFIICSGLCDCTDML